MEKSRKHRSKTTEIGVRLKWRSVGDFSDPYTNPDLSHIVWSPVRAPRKAGLYRIIIPLGTHGERAIYIGESANIARRLSSYGEDHSLRRKKSTESRVSDQIRQALRKRLSVSVDAATTGFVSIGGAEFPIDMLDLAQRRFAEAAAVVAESLNDTAGQVVMINHVSGEYFWLDPS
ncbi:hypothetical protein [Kribbella sp. NPDC000426]|uniref:hypothetical protein n=1 Tax=Kribbella sp. NPDC000426 TaxID=3154255 RepID=UPI0033320986